MDEGETVKGKENIKEKRRGTKIGNGSQSDDYTSGAYVNEENRWKDTTDLRRIFEEKKNDPTLRQTVKQLTNGRSFLGHTADCEFASRF